MTDSSTKKNDSEEQPKEEKKAPRLRTGIRAGIVSPRDAASGLPTGKRMH